MLRYAGIIILLTGCIGFGFSYRRKMKENLDSLYTLRQIYKMFQNEIDYSKASLPEACRRISERTKPPYSRAFLAVYEEMLLNSGKHFGSVWKKHMEVCLQAVPISGADKKICMDFGDCAGFMDGRMQASSLEQYMHHLDESVKKLEADMENKCKVVMSLSVMGGLMAVIILI